MGINIICYITIYIYITKGILALYLRVGNFRGDPPDAIQKRNSNSLYHNSGPDVKLARVVSLILNLNLFQSSTLPSRDWSSVWVILTDYQRPTPPCVILALICAVNLNIFDILFLHQ